MMMNKLAILIVLNPMLEFKIVFLISEAKF